MYYTDADYDFNECKHMLRKSWIDHGTYSYSLDISNVNEILINKMTDKELRTYIHNNYLTKDDWNVISRHQKLSIAFVLDYEKYINFYALSSNPNLTDGIVEAFDKELDWRVISQYYPLTEKFVKRWWNRFNGHYLINNPTCTIHFLDIVKKSINWSEVSESVNLTEEIVRAFPDYIDWETLIDNTYVNFISEDFIREYRDYINVYELVYKKLGYQGYENILREFKDKIDWDKFRDEHDHAITEGYIELHDYWWAKKKSERKRLKYLW